MASYLGRVQPPATGTGRMFQTLPGRDQRVAAIQAGIRGLPARTYEASDEFARVQAEAPVAVPTLTKTMKGRNG
jgi:hypothetical protein